MKVIVIGAGIAGSSTAFHLARKGVEVVLVNKTHDGQATAAGAGIVCPWLKQEDENWYRLAREGALYYPSLIEYLKENGQENLGYGFVGALRVSSNMEELDEVEQRAYQRKSDTPEVGDITRLTATEAKKLFPPLDENLSAVHVTGAARVDGRLIRDALQREAVRLGAEVVDGEATLAVEKGEITGVNVDGQFISGDRVVVAAGAWTPRLVEPLGIEVPIEPQKGQIVHLELDGQNTDEWPVIYPDSSHYLLAFENSRVVVGATRETGSGFDYRMTAGGIKEVIDEALAVAPGLRDAAIHDIRIGFRPKSPDAVPLLGTVPTHDNLVIATGLGASGLTMGPYFGALAAKLAINEAIDIDLTPYNPIRKATTV